MFVQHPSKSLFGGNLSLIDSSFPWKPTNHQLIEIPSKSTKLFIFQIQFKSVNLLKFFFVQLSSKVKLIEFRTTTNNFNI